MNIKMFDIPRPTTERAILIGLRTKDITRDILVEQLQELEELATTAGADTIMKITQDRVLPDRALYLGKGKVEELAQLADLNDIDLIIFNDDLSPMQVRNLEKMVSKKIVDRSGLILDIFASHAKTKEAKTQVELAQLQYLLPRLTRAWTHLSKQLGGIGTKGPGETQIETDRRIIRTRISSLKEKLVKIESQKQTQTQQRKDFFRVSLVGYTNAGKSTLFNLITNAEVLAEDKLFATLDSTTKSFELDKTNKILLSDTVGFIRKLPAHLIASFKSTLNEVDQADLILHVVDLSHPYFKDHIQVVEQTLKELHCEKKPQIKVFNKVDLLQDRSLLDELKHSYEHSVVISAERGINISSLLKMIKDNFIDSHVEESVKIKISDAKIISIIHSLTEVLSIKYTQKFVNITYRATKENSNKIRKMIDG